MLPDKSLLQSLTVWGAAMFAAAQSLEAAGVIPPGAATAAVGIVKSVGALLTVIGVRRVLGEAVVPPQS